MPPPAEYRIRHGGPQDISAIASFNIRMAKETEDLALDPDTITAGVRAMVEHPGRGFYLVAETGPAGKTRIVASLMVTMEWSDWRNGMFWWIQSVYVMPDHRRRGLYRSLYNRVKELAAGEKGVCGFRLYVEKDNQAAKSTYLALGMSETAYRMYEQEVFPHTE